ncbi:MAG: flavodoxin family protein, partial [Schwartzia sp.]|nr:flavodoxin family protein [Schwartzia sp. (in: firmicutes)]
MNRREFLKVSGMGALTFFLSGYTLAAAPAEKKITPPKEKGGVSGGKPMKIVVVTSSPHPKNESTS